MFDRFRYAKIKKVVQVDLWTRGNLLFYVHLWVELVVMCCGIKYISSDVILHSNGKAVVSNGDYGKVLLSSDSANAIPAVCNAAASSNTPNKKRFLITTVSSAIFFYPLP
ncbi:MAG: hypothetical protein PHF94_06200, partial [Methanothrix sp.]|nr:hypothetical protein [Methanothrix sp.]